LHCFRHFAHLPNLIWREGCLLLLLRRDLHSLLLLLAMQMQLSSSLGPFTTFGHKIKKMLYAHARDHNASTSVDYKNEVCRLRPCMRDDHPQSRAVCDNVTFGRQSE
jgi:hypothetical protein